jgi:hypothetical protein
LIRRESGVWGVFFGRREGCIGWCLESEIGKFYVAATPVPILAIDIEESCTCCLRATTILDDMGVDVVRGGFLPENSESWENQPDIEQVMLQLGMPRQQCQPSYGQYLPETIRRTSPT